MRVKFHNEINDFRDLRKTWSGDCYTFAVRIVTQFPLLRPTNLWPAPNSAKRIEKHKNPGALGLCKSAKKALVIASL